MSSLHKGRIFIACLSLVVLLSGCSYSSDDKKFASTNLGTPTEKTNVPQTESAVQWLKTALETAKTNPEAQKYWYKGFVKNTILARTTTSMFEGAVIQPDGYNVDVRIARQPFQYYRIGDKRFIRSDDSWITAQEEPLPFDVLSGFEDLLPLMNKAVQLKDEKVYGEECIPFQIKMTAGDWLKVSNSSLFEPLQQQLVGRSDMGQILDDSTIKMTIWIGKDDHLLHQYETWIILPLPGAGYMDQQVMLQFYKYNDPGIKIKEPEEVEKYLLY